MIDEKDYTRDGLGEPDEPTQTSPIEVEDRKPETMNFFDALRKVSEGKKIRSLSWPADEYGFLKEGVWLEVYRQGRLHTWQVSSGDLEAEDWIVIE